MQCYYHRLLRRTPDSYRDHRSVILFNLKRYCTRINQHCFANKKWLMIQY